MVLVTYRDREMSRVPSESFRSSQFSRLFCALCATHALLSTKYKKLLSVIEDLTDELVARLDSLSFMGIAIFDFILVTAAIVTGEEYGLDSHCTFIRIIFETQL